MTYVKNSSRGINAEFNTKLFSRIEFFLKSFLINDLWDSFGEKILKGRMRWHKRELVYILCEFMGDAIEWQSWYMALISLVPNLSKKSRAFGMLVTYLLKVREHIIWYDMYKAEIVSYFLYVNNKEFKLRIYVWYSLGWYLHKKSSLWRSVFW